MSSPCYHGLYPLRIANTKMDNKMMHISAYNSASSAKNETLFSDLQILKREEMKLHHIEWERW